MTQKSLSELALNIRQRMLLMSLESDAATHLGGGLSLVEILSCLYGKILNFKINNPYWEHRDRFILSKGHGVLAFFATLNSVGMISDSELKTFMTDGSTLIAHPILDLARGIESSNGSLGQGLSFGAGMAKAAKLAQKNHSVFVLMGDGECNEGSIWEAAQVSAQLGLGNLVAIIDANGLQSDGEVGLGMHPEGLQMKFQSFGWETVLIDGHNLDSLCEALLMSRKEDKPLCIVAQTIKGKGISFMESNNVWHHARLTKANYDLAMSELKMA